MQWWSAAQSIVIRACGWAGQENRKRILARMTARKARSKTFPPRDTHTFACCRKFVKREIDQCSKRGAVRRKFFSSSAELNREVSSLAMRHASFILFSCSSRFLAGWDPRQARFWLAGARGAWEANAE